jgi:hypothetical protein
MAFLTAYLLYKNSTAAERPEPQYYREAARILEDLVRIEENYVRVHPEVYYFLARCYRLDYSYDRARRFMVDYVEALTGPGDRAVEGEEPPSGGISDEEGTTPKDEHPDYGVPRTVAPSEVEEATENTEGGSPRAEGGAATDEPQTDAREAAEE